MAPDLYELVPSALKNAEKDYGEQLRTMTLGQQAADLQDCDAEIGEHLFDDVVEALIEYRINEKPSELPAILNKTQYEGLKHRLLDPAHAIRFALSVYDGLDFLRAWNEGNWRGCMEWTTWKDFK